MPPRPSPPFLAEDPGNLPGASFEPAAQHPIDPLARPATSALPDLAALQAQLYTQLRAAAQLHMNRERPSHTLSATALVHEAYLKLTAPREHPFANPAHFYAAAAQAMRRILVDHARAHAVRQAPAAQRAESTSDALPDVAALAAAAPEKILAVDIALTRLESEDPDSAAVVRLRFFAGLSVDQAAETLAISPRTAARLWTFARARLHQLLSTSESA